MGKLSVACDAFNDSRFNAKNFAALGVRSFIAVPLAKDGKFNSLLSVIDLKTRQWTAEDLALMQELVSRIWARVELARAEEMLRDSESHLRHLLRQKDEFIGVAGHELKTAVTSMKIFGELVQQRLEETENKDDIHLITKLNAQIKRLTLLINHLWNIPRFFK
ncbi:GAF domain-containing protein [Danxiaibacter flavus]|uniref:histidine kinase n=1 Tax=Danxiaibacter flavus TaxID=3049108 RepID=A0ABV3ZJE0_9BACT|nr:GAF domain-containing protein [Chitinophagaceae bacterium DXS]